VPLRLTIRTCLTVIIGGLLVSCSPASDSPESANDRVNENTDLLIKHVTVIDAVNGVRENMDVVVQTGIIRRVVSSASADELEADVVLDGRGKFLIPGLWDAHVHLTFDSEIEDSMFRLFIAHGVTSVRDTGGQVEKVLAWREQSRNSLAPNVYVAGPLIDGAPTVYNGDAEGFPKIAVTARTPAEVEALVDELAAAGVDLIKAYEMLSPESFKALITRAKYHGLPVTGHVPLSMTAEQVSNAGMNSMEHLRNLEMACSEQAKELFARRQQQLKNEPSQLGSVLRRKIHAEQHFAAVDSYDPTRCTALLATLANNDTWQIPTLALTMVFNTLYFGTPDWQQSFKYLPPKTADKWLQSATRFAEALSVSTPSRENSKVVADWKMALISQMLDAGVTIMAGTDTPIFYMTPGFSLHKELAVLVEAGMSPMQALESATLTPARYFSLQDRQGSISANKIADLVLLDANPLTDIANTMQISAVIKNGRALDRSALDNLLNP